MKRRSISGLRLILLLAALPASACQEPPEPIQVREGQVVVLNQGAEDWRNVQIWLNDQYRVVFPDVQAGQRLIVPLDTFVAGYGQRFDRQRQVPVGVLVLATTSSGRPVRLAWGKVTRFRGWVQRTRPSWRS
jgi:hypothetical protein